MHRLVGTQQRRTHPMDEARRLCVVQSVVGLVGIHPHPTPSQLYHNQDYTITLLPAGQAKVRRTSGGATHLVAKLR